MTSHRQYGNNKALFVWDVTSEGVPEHFVEINDAGAGILGYTKDELLKKSLVEVLAAEKRKAFMSHMESLRRYQQIMFTTTFMSVDGKQIPMNVDAHYIKVDGKERIIGIGSAVSKRGRSEKIARIFESLGSELGGVNTAKEAAMTVLNAADRLIGWDAAFVEIYSEEEDKVFTVVNFDTLRNGERKEFPPLFQGEIPGGVLRRTILEGPQIVLRDDPSKADGGELIPFGDEERKSASLLFARIRKKGEKNIGFLSIQSYTPYAYDEEDLELLQILTDYCCGALERTFAEKKLRMKEAQVRLLLEQIPAILWTTDNNLTITLLKGERIGVLTTNPDEILGHTVYDFFGTKDASFTPIALHRRALEGISGSYELQIKDFFFHCHVEPLRDRKGDIIGCIGVAHDVTERKRAEEELKHAHRIYREAIENAQGVPYFLNYETGRYDFMGAGWEKLLGVPPEASTFEVISNLVLENVVPDRDVPSDPEKYLEEFVRGDLKRYRMDARIRTPSGETKWLSDCSVLVHDEASNRVVGSLGILQDITNRKEAEKNSQVFAALGEKLNAVTTPKEAGMVILETAKDLIGWDSCLLSFYEEGADEIHSIINFDTIDGVCREVPPPPSGTKLTEVTRRTLHEGAQLILRNDSSPDKYEELHPFGDTKHRSASLMFCPIRKGSRTIGLLSIQSYTPNAYNHNDLKLLQFLADHCSGAIERTYSEEKLRKGEERLRLITEQIPALIWTTDSELRFTLLQGAGLKALELEPSAWLGKKLTDFFDTNDESFLPIATHRRALNGESATYEMHRNGIYFHSYVEPLCDEEGNRIGCINISHDITQLKKAEEELLKARDELEKRVAERTRELVRSNTLLKNEILERKRVEEELAHSEAIYREAIENAAGVPYQLIYDGYQYRFMGEGIKALLGYTPQELTGEKLVSLVDDIIIIDPDAPQQFDEYVKAFCEGKIDQYRVDLLIHTRSGELKWISDCSVPLHDEESGHVIGSLGILQDITKRKQVEERARLQEQQLIQADKMVALGTLVSGVAHEINNPNNFVMLNAPVLLDSWRSVEPILEDYFKEHGDFVVGGINYSEMRNHIPVLFSGILEGAKRIKNIVQELRDFTRQHPAELMQPMDINAVLKSALMLLSNMIKGATENFSIKYGKELPKVRGNFQRLEQVIINLIQNACQSLPDKYKAIEVSTHFNKAKNTIELIVRDEGKGIPNDMLPYIKKPFFTTKRDHGGTGLGLSISSNIINEHGGKLEIFSQKDKGTTAVILLPVMQAVK